MQDIYDQVKPKQLVDALQQCNLSSSMKKLLRAHLDSTGHAMTMSNLAKRAGYKNYRAGNAQMEPWTKDRGNP